MTCSRRGGVAWASTDEDEEEVEGGEEGGPLTITDDPSSRLDSS